MVVSPIDNLLHFLCALVRGNNIPGEEEEYVDHRGSKFHTAVSLRRISHNGGGRDNDDATVFRFRLPNRTE